MNRRLPYLVTAGMVTDVEPRAGWYVGGFENQWPVGPFRHRDDAIAWIELYEWDEGADAEVSA